MGEAKNLEGRLVCTSHSRLPKAWLTEKAVLGNYLGSGEEEVTVEEEARVEEWKTWVRK